MTRSFDDGHRRVCELGRNLAAALIALVVLGYLYARFDTPAGGDAGAEVNAAFAVPPVSAQPEDATTTRRPVTGSAQASISDRPGTDGRGRQRGNTPVLRGRLALLMNLLLMERGRRRLSRIGAYTATFSKQERLDDATLKRQVMRMKLRHEPFSVYLKWLEGDRGRELIYVEGRNDGDMIVHVGGWKGRLLPTLKLDPTGATAMKEARHPVTEIGLLELVERAIAHRRRDLQRADRIDCRMYVGERFDDRDCYRFVIEYESPDLSPDYRKSAVYVDKKWSVPVSVRNYGWPEAEAAAASVPPEHSDKERPESPPGRSLDDPESPMLVEAYGYTDLEMNADLDADDFDLENPEYRFR